MPQTKLHLTDQPPRVQKGELAYRGDGISAQEARDLVALCRRRPWQGDTTIVHITRADSVKEDVWNSLLKLLEEPPDYLQVHLYAPSTDALPRTIKSRSFVTRESLPKVLPEDATRLIRLIENGDALTLLREADRHTDLAETRRVLFHLWVYCVESFRIDSAVVIEHYLQRLRGGVSSRVLVKSLLLTLAIRHRQAQLDPQ